MPVALSARGLGRSYGEFEALRDFDLALEPGQCVAVIGRNGSGKTTAVRLIAGLLEPTEGTVEIYGARLDHEPASLQARAAIALVPDNPTLYPDLTAGEHLELAAIAHGVADEELDQRIDSLLLQVGLDGRRDSRPGELSRGMRQKLQLACALIRPYRVLVLDEPVVGLDPSTQRTLRELLLTAKRDGAAIVLTTHQLEFARGIADRALVLAEGVIVADGRYEEIVDGPVVHERGLV